MSNKSDKSSRTSIAAPRSNSLRSAFKLVVSAATLGFLLTSVPLDSVWSAIRGAQPAWLLLALVIFLGAQCVSAVRFAYIARELGGQLSVHRALRVHFIGLWLNQVLPTGLGGDVVKAVLVRHELGGSIAIRSVILDRLSGLIILLMHAALFLPAYWMMFSNSKSIISISLFAAAALMGLLLASHYANWLRLRMAWLPGLTHVIGLIDDTKLFRTGDALRKQLWTSLVVHLSGIAVYAMIGKSLGVSVTLIHFALLTPLVFLIALIPVSFAGWGVRELGAIWLFGLAGASADIALVMSILFGLILIVAGSPGLLFLLSSSMPQNCRRTADRLTEK